MVKQLVALAVVGLMAVPAEAQISTSPRVLLVAGGGGGSGVRTAGTDGQAGISGADGRGPEGGSGGSAGDGGAGGTSNISSGGGGAGLLSDGGRAPFGGQGGRSGPSYAGGGIGTSQAGGFGGGGQGFEGAGGGSFLDPSLVAVSGLPIVAIGSPLTEQAANGYVDISFLGTNSFTQRFNFTGSAQVFTFSETGLYNIVAAGAQGGGSNEQAGGLGALLGGQGVFAGGSTLSLIVGGAGLFDPGVTQSGGGGGGTFVFLTGIGAPTAAVPEPGTWAMAVLGFGAVGGVLRRRRTPAGAPRRGQPA